MKGGLPVHYTASFYRDYQALPGDIQDKVDACIRDMQSRDPLPSTRRSHRVTPRGHKPAIFTVDVTTNKAYKLSFNVLGNTFLLRRVGTHKQIDRTP